MQHEIILKDGRKVLVFVCEITILGTTFEAKVEASSQEEAIQKILRSIVIK